VPRPDVPGSRCELLGEHREAKCANCANANDGGESAPADRFLRRLRKSEGSPIATTVTAKPPSPVQFRAAPPHSNRKTLANWETRWWRASGPWVSNWAVCRECVGLWPVWRAKAGWRNPWAVGGRATWGSLGRFGEREAVRYSLQCRSLA
jgi:hypothetical protein